eukprot:CAMPEP_0118897362 /NCGR_PEP_ID=MMETSP1166-20130328/4795_1 /TAXON_ID=1104430 /ORGANISM="Chrysoreinhardia sp, Strain CCMP3193" /LENGTH=467 /DNA_ID=CAMNT_0006836431 /DNA_START=9 /DNA_END=1412 /DNA_ORIENTATION=+
MMAAEQPAVEEEQEDVGGDDDEEMPMTMLRALAVMLGAPNDDDAQLLNALNVRGAEVFVRHLAGHASSNASMVEGLRATGALTSDEAFRAFLAVDRAAYLPAAETAAYANRPVRIAPVHQSAPSVYAAAVESLDLRRGQSFLNIGGGTGYLSAIVAEICGADAPHVALEIESSLVEAARLRHHSVEFVHGDAYDIDVDRSPKFDRVYVGAGAKASAKFLFRLLKQPGGKLVGPFQNERSPGQTLILVEARGRGAYKVTPRERNVNFAWLVDGEDDDGDDDDDDRNNREDDRNTGEDDDDNREDATTKKRKREKNTLRLPGCLLWGKYPARLFPSSFLERAALLRSLARAGRMPRDLPWDDLWEREILPWLPSDSFEERARPGLCMACGAAFPSLARCLVCGGGYCSKKCQAQAWSFHVANECPPPRGEDQGRRRRRREDTWLWDEDLALPVSPATPTVSFIIGLTDD